MWVIVLIKPHCTYPTYPKEIILSDFSSFSHEPLLNLINHLTHASETWKIMVAIIDW